VGNEAAERFSYYGMRAILWIHLTSLFVNFAPVAQLEPALRTAAESHATQVMHLFMASVYALPMIGALVADRLLGKYNVIIWLSLVYCAGHGVLAVAAGEVWGMYLGLALIAIGSGGIKPCVSANVGDQFGPARAHLVPRVFQIFYFSINFGSFFATLIIPWVKDRWGYEVAFGIPGVLMGLATLIFWLGRDRYVRVAPRPGGKLGAFDAVSAIFLFLAFAALVLGGKIDLGIPARLGLAAAFVLLWWATFRARERLEAGTGFLPVLLYALRHRRERQPGQGFFDVARARFGDEAADGPPAVLRIMMVFSAVSLFWALFEQHSSSWINQANRMDLALDLPLLGATTLKPSQIPALNPLMVMILIPLLNGVVVPAVVRLGVTVTPLRKMTVGMLLAALSFVAVALLQMRIDTLGEGHVPVLWQILPYLVITASEVLVSVTGLEFAYTQAPRSMKSTIMGFWLLNNTIGNLLVAFLAGFESLPLAQFFWIFAGLMAVATVVFATLAYFYRGRSYLQA
jgi:POT family proton-dependent oligopeptide transporter